MSRVDLAYQHAIEAETALLRGILDRRTDLELPSHVTALDPEAFLDPSHRVIWAAIQAVTLGGGLLDSWVLTRALTKLGAAERQIATAMDLFATAANDYGAADIRPRIAVVADAYKRRLLASGMARLSERAITEDLRVVEGEFSEIAGKVAQAGVSRLRASTDYSRQFEAYLSGQPILALDERDNQVVLGSAKLDEAIVANPGRLMAVGGLPSTGKTALAVQMAVRTALTGRRVALGSLEMDEDEISARLVANACGVNSLQALRHGHQASPEDRMILQHVRQNVVGLHGAAGDSWTSLEAAIVREHRRAPLSVAIVDYLQLLEAPDIKSKRNDNEAARIGEITKSAKRLAQRLRICVVILSQFNRDVRECEEPTLQNFRGSGQIEQDLDIALMLWAEKPRYEPGQERVIFCRVAKNRGGERYTKARLGFNPKTSRFWDDVRETDASTPQPDQPDLGIGR